MRWLAHFFGFAAGDGNSASYLWWSGTGSDLAYAGIFWALWRKHNCHVHRCWRIGRHLVEGTPYTVCRRHDPSGPVTAESVRKRYHLYAGRRPGRG
jgi:hypothetical protein